MCGRCCLTLEPDQVQTACQYFKQGSGANEKTKQKKPLWRHEYNCGRTYQPSFNVAPSDIVPILVSSQHFNFPENESTANKKSTEQRPGADDRVIVPMLWGMIPFWYKGEDYRKHGLTTNNCRLETMLTSRLYKHAFDKGQRCVMVCEGFYEWQTTDPKAKKSSERAAYYIYNPQPSDIIIESQETWINRLSDVNLLKIAGLFDVWKNPTSGDQMYSFTVITFESDKSFSWMHHRSPAILETEQQLADWLDFTRVTDKKTLLGLLKPAQHLKWHRVSNIVNNARNKSEDCNKPFDVTKVKSESPRKTSEAGSSSLMQAWLQGTKRKSNTDLKVEEEVKKPKVIKSEPVHEDKKAQESDTNDNKLETVDKKQFN